jgi:putative redox protein
LTITATSQSVDSFQQTIRNGELSFLVADIDPESGGQGQAPTPFDLLFGAWGACTNMTLQVYTRRKGWPMSRVSTTLQKTERGSQIWVEKRIQVWGSLTPEQVAKLKLVAEKCPVNLFIMQQQSQPKVLSTIECLPT